MAEADRLNLGGADPAGDNREGGKLDWTPSPDPTVLTTAALYREVAALQELIETRLTSAKEYTDSEFEAVRDRHDEYAQRIDLQFRLVEQQRIEQKEDTKTAVDAALAAQKEAVREQTAASERSIAKSEAATTKQIDSLGNSFATTQTSLLARIDELKERITEVDRKAEGPRQQRIGAQEDRTGIYALVGVVATLIIVGISIISLVIAFHK